MTTPSPGRVRPCPVGSSRCKARVQAGAGGLLPSWRGSPRPCRMSTVTLLEGALRVRTQTRTQGRGCTGGGEPWGEPGWGGPAGACPVRRPLRPRCPCRPRWGISAQAAERLWGAQARPSLSPRVPVRSSWRVPPVGPLGGSGSQAAGCSWLLRVLRSCPVGAPRAAQALVLTEGPRAAGTVSHPQEGFTQTGQDSSSRGVYCRWPQGKVAVTTHEAPASGRPDRRLGDAGSLLRCCLGLRTE